MLDRILWFLTDIQREVYRLVKIVGHTQTEAADIMGTSIPNINKHLKKAMDRIEEQKEKMWFFRAGLKSRPFSLTVTCKADDLTESEVTHGNETQNHHQCH